MSDAHAGAPTSPPRIDEACCVGCSQCRLICRVEAIHQHGATCRIEAEECALCGDCLWVCPAQCISADKD